MHLICNQEIGGSIPSEGTKYMTLVQQLVELAQEIESEDPIDWGMLSVNENDAYAMIATSVLENYLNTDADSRDIMMLATVVKLTVENFVLNLKLLKGNHVSSQNQSE
jgi:hypothetical protein